MSAWYSVLSLPAGTLLSSKRDMFVAEPAKLRSALSCLQESTNLHAHISLFKWGNNWDMEGRKSMPPNSPHLHHISSWEIKIYPVIIKLLYSYFQDCTVKDGIATSFFCTSELLSLLDNTSKNLLPKKTWRGCVWALFPKIRNTFWKLGFVFAVHIITFCPSLSFQSQAIPQKAEVLYRPLGFLVEIFLMFRLCILGREIYINSQLIVISMN